MKKLLAVLSLVIWLWSCAQDEPQPMYAWQVEGNVSNKAYVYAIVDSRDNGQRVYFNNGVASGQSPIRTGDYFELRLWSDDPKPEKVEAVTYYVTFEGIRSQALWQRGCGCVYSIQK